MALKETTLFQLNALKYLLDSQSLKMNNLKLKIDFIYKGKVLYTLGGFIFLITFYILFVLRPNEINLQEQRFSYLVTCLFHAGLPSLVFLFLPQLISKKNKTHSGNWNTIKEVIYIIFLLILIGIGNFLIRDFIYSNEYNWSLNYLIEEVINGLTIGIIIAFIVVLLRIALELNRNLRKAHQLMDSLSILPTSEKSPTIISIEGKVKSEKFELKVEDFLFAKASGNYIDIYLSNGGLIKKLTKRISLTAFIQHFAVTQYIIRTHKSYIVNIFKIKNIKGNKAGLFLDMENFQDLTIPVSRKYLNNFEHTLKTNKL